MNGDVGAWNDAAWSRDGADDCSGRYLRGDGCGETAAYRRRHKDCEQCRFIMAAPPPRGRSSLPDIERGSRKPIARVAACYIVAPSQYDVRPRDSVSLSRTARALECS